VFDNVAFMEAPATAGITPMIAQRMKVLRAEARLSGPALAAAMNKLGIPWNRTTVAKLETGKRESISAHELLVLAVVLDVPLVWLLADPKSDTPVPIAKGIDVDPQTALLWMTGKQALSDQPGAAWSKAATVLAHLNGAVDAITVLGSLDKLAREPAPTPKHRETQDQMICHQLELLSWSLRDLEKSSGTMLPLPLHVVRQAKRLGVRLPGYEVEGGGEPSQ
jgi:transcriptional regulator with XRE-family HTH domain